MSYSDLTLKERMEKAEEFCILLSRDMKLPEDVIKELSVTFSLSSQQAHEAYKNSKVKYKKDHLSASKNKYLELLASFLVALACCAFYFFIGIELSGFFLIFVVLFAASIVGIMVYSVKSIAENMLLNYPWLLEFRKNFFVKLFPTVLIVLAIAIGNYCLLKEFSKSNTVMRTLRLSKDVEFLTSSGKNKSKYYQFIFDGYSKKFTFSSRDYRFANSLDKIKKLKKAELVTCCFQKKDIRNLHEKTFFDQYNRILNISFSGVDVIDFEYRNKKMKTSAGRFLSYALLAMALEVLIVFYLIRKAYTGIKMNTDYLFPTDEADNPK
jgi:hypothetical protein